MFTMQPNTNETITNGAITKYLRSNHRNLDPALALTESVAVLAGVSADEVEGLKKVNIETIFDLAASDLFADATQLVDAAEKPESEIARAGTAPLDLIDRKAQSIPVSELQLEPISTLRALAPARAQQLSQALGVETIRDLALWPPYHSARAIANVALGGLEELGDDPERPLDLVPATGRYPTERVQYEVILLDKVHAPRDLNGSPLEDAGPIDVSVAAAPEAGFRQVATGALLIFTQSWYTLGLSLGQLLHALALAPGESTRIALIDWTRRTRAAVSEGVTETEALQSTLDHNRSISEVTHAVATEMQTGRSETVGVGSAFSAGQGGGAAGGGQYGPFSGAGAAGHSLGLSSGMSAARSWSVSTGTRNITADMTQTINDRTHQASNLARNRWATAVREVSQSEHEELSTRAVTNYNHMHALTIQYYEVVQLYRTIVELARVTRCLFVPMKVQTFDARIARRFRAALAAAGLTPEVRALTNLEPDHVAVEAPHRVRPWNRLKEMEFATGEVVGTPESTVVVLPRRFAKIFNFGFWAEVPIDQAIVTFTSGESHVLKLRDVHETQNVSNPRFQPEMGDLFNRDKNGHDFSEIARIEFVKKSDNEDYEGDVDVILTFRGDNEDFRKLEEHLKALGEFTIMGTFSRAGGPPDALDDTTGASLTTTIHVPKDAAQFMAFAFTESIADDDLVKHLNDNAFYYSQAVWRSLDSATLGLLLSPYTFAGRPMIETIDPVPVAVAGNYLVFRTYAEDESWTEFLEEKNLKLGRQQETIVPLPSGGVFAEAVLGRSNSAEKLDVTRFWDWQDSPIPIEAPEIAALQSGSRAQPEDLEPGQLSGSVLNIVNPPALPDPQGMAAILAAIQNGNMFRDMSGLASTIGFAQAAMGGAFEGARDAAAQAGQNAKTAADLLAALYGGGRAPGSAAPNESDSKSSNKGQMLNHAAKLDEKTQKSGQAGASSSAETATPSAGATSKQVETFDSFLPVGGGDGLFGEVLETVLGMAPGGSSAASPAKAAWPRLDRTTVLTRLKDLKADPNLFNQGALGLCTAATFYHHIIQKNPDEFHKYGMALFDTGIGFLGNLKVAPDDDLRNTDYSALAKRFLLMPPQADWMLMSALRDSTNWFFDFEGGPDESVAMRTSLKELSEWYKDTGFYSSVDFSDERGLAKIKTIQKTANNHVALGIKMTLLGMPGRAHMITLESPMTIDEANNKVTFDYWTWGKPVQTLKTTVDALKAHYLHVVTATF